MECASRLGLRPVSTGNDEPKWAAEQRAWALIDRPTCRYRLVGAGQEVADLIAHEGVACREVVMQAGHGRVDYLLLRVRL